MSVFTLIKHTTTSFRNARMFSRSNTYNSGGWGRSNINTNSNVMHNYNMYVNFGVPKNYSGNISILFDCEKHTVETNSESTPIKISHPKTDEIKIINRAPFSYYTYS
jgi:hypothetical protein